MTKYFVIRNIRGRCSSVEILKGCMLTFWNVKGVHANLLQCWRGAWSDKGCEPLC